MKKILLSAATILTMAATMAFTTKGDSTTYKVSSSSKVDFSGSKKSGYHPGYFPVKAGSVTVVDGKLTGGSFTIDMAGIKITDEAGAQLEGHLKNKDFFETDKFGTATFDISNVIYKDATNATIEGSLTIKGLKFNQKFEAKVRQADEKGFFAEAFFSLDRTTIGIAYGVPNISSDVQIGVHISGTK